MVKRSSTLSFASGGVFNQGNCHASMPQALAGTCALSII